MTDQPAATTVARTRSGERRISMRMTWGVPLMIAAALLSLLTGVPRASAEVAGATDLRGPRHSTDIRSIEVDHRVRRATFTVRFATRTRRPLQVDLDIDTNDAGQRDFVVFWAPWSGRPTVYAVHPFKPRCQARVSHPHQWRTLRVSIPRRCLGRPRWIALRVTSYRGPDGMYSDSTRWTPRARRG